MLTLDTDKILVEEKKKLKQSKPKNKQINKFSKQPRSSTTILWLRKKTAKSILTGRKLSK